MLKFKLILFLVLVGTLYCTIPLFAQSQNCPPNIDFESGDFTGWKCYTGHTFANAGNNDIIFDYTGGPVSGQQTMYSNYSGNGLDEYGNFPVNCPNGSGYSVKLGNNQAGNEAEGISYDFTIPAGSNMYNLIYNYAVVFQDPGHQHYEQPRLVIEIQNLTDGTIINCSSFTFFANGTILPGFELSDISENNTPIWYKKWTAVSVNLDGLAGKNIRLFFKTADCTFRRHFGYAYIDVNTECSDKFTGAEFCPDDSVVFVTAPYGYQGYTWYNNTFTQILGSGQTLFFNPPPSTGTTVGVILTPYNGYGCLDTLYTELKNTLNYTAEAGADKISCNNNFVRLGVPPKPGWKYRWSPSAGLSDPNISNPMANPSVTTTYFLTISHSGGGCNSRDSVQVKAMILDNTMQLLGKRTWCIGSGDSTVLVVNPADSIQWYKDNIPITGATQAVYPVTSTGSYFAKVFNFAGCVLSTITEQIDIATIPVAGIGINNMNQCEIGNQFVFTNNSSNAVGAMSYQWTMGDGSSYTSRNISHSYALAGTYQVKMITRSNANCADSSSLSIIVYPNVKAAFNKVADICMGLPLQFVNNTVDPGNTVVNYAWDFGNGQTSVLRDPPLVTYPSAGFYRIRLSVSSAQCPLPINTLQQIIKVDKPTTAERYPVKYAVKNLPLTLRARPIGKEVLWSPAISLNDASSYNPIFKSAQEQLYTISLKTISGCITVDTQLVKINNQVAIYVPNSFTPNNDGTNDILRPFMIGIKELKYFKIFNRWGQLIYQTSNLLDGWDGKFKGAPVEMQTVVWMLEGVGVDDLKYNAKGSTILIH